MAESKGAKDAIFDPCTSDFATVVTTTAFVDKTMLIKDVFDEIDRNPEFLLVTAPPRSGKSTNLHMVRRFLEIQVDGYVNRQTLAQTDNYKLFTENDLAISRQTEFFTRHFGKHPVLYMDWKPLSSARDYDSMIDIFRTITMEMFKLHRFFLNVKNVWTEDIGMDDFIKHSFSICKSCNGENEVMYSPKYLSKLLYRYFEKKVFVLIDNCDAFVASDLFRKKSEGRDKMLCFIQTVVDSLLKNNQCVGRALLTGVLPLTGDGFPFGSDKIRCYSFMNSWPFYTYYGLTVDELDGLLEKLVTDDNERYETKRKIESFFNIYTVDQESESIYNILSVLKYLRTKQISVTDKYCMPNFSGLYKHSKIRDELVKSLKGNELQFDITQALSIKDITQMNNLIECSSDVNVSSSSVNTVFVLLYHFGYFSINRIAYDTIGTFTIANEESKSSLAKDILKTNQELYCYTWNHADKLCSAVYSITSAATTDTKLLETTLEDWFRNLKPDLPKAIEDLSTRLFMILVASYKYNRTEWRISPDNITLLCMLLQKLNGETVCLSVEVNTRHSETDETVCLITTTDPPADEKLRFIAVAACHRVICYSQRDQMFDGFTDVEMIPVVGIGYSPETRSCKVKIVATNGKQKPSSSPDLSQTALRSPALQLQSLLKKKKKKKKKKKTGANMRHRHFTPLDRLGTY